MWDFSRWTLIVLLLAIALANPILAADHVIERSVIKGIGYRNHELFGQTAIGGGQSIAERISGSGSFYDKTYFEMDAVANTINYSQDAEFEYFPTSYQTGTFDQKWTDRLTVVNRDAGAAVTEDYTNAEHIQKSTEVRTFGNATSSGIYGNNGIEMHINSNVIGVAHIGWVSKDTKQDEKGKYLEIGRSSDDLTGTFSIEKYIELLQNSTNYESQVDMLPCA
ncbi:MAG: hypothetical protein ACE14P_05350 [Methanotrichaceae archaeon]